MLNRHDTGRSSLAELVDGWIKLTTLSSTAFARAANDCLGSKKLHNVQLEQLRHGLAKQLGCYAFDAIGALNIASYRYHIKEKPHQDKRLNELLMLIPPLHDADGPFGMAYFVEMFVGLRECPPLPDSWLGAKKREELPDPEWLAKQMGKTIRSVLQSRDGDIIEQLDRLLEHYPSKDPDRITRCKQVCLGLSTYEPGEAENEALALCMALTGFTDEPWDLAMLATGSEPQRSSSTGGARK